MGRARLMCRLSLLCLLFQLADDAHYQQQQVLRQLGMEKLNKLYHSNAINFSTSSFFVAQLVANLTTV